MLRNIYLLCKHSLESRCGHNPCQSGSFATYGGSLHGGGSTKVTTAEADLDGWWWTEFESSVVRTHRLASHDPRARNRSVAGPIPGQCQHIVQCRKDGRHGHLECSSHESVGASLAVNNAVCVVIVLKQGGK